MATPQGHNIFPIGFITHSRNYANHLLQFLYLKKLLTAWVKSEMLLVMLFVFLLRFSLAQVVFFCRLECCYGDYYCKGGCFQGFTHMYGGLVIEPFVVPVWVSFLVFLGPLHHPFSL